MNCTTCEKHISRMIDGELDRSLSELVGKHLEECSTCRQVYTRLTTMNSSLKLYGDFTAPRPGLAGRVKENISTVGERKKRNDLRTSLWSWAPAAAMVLVLALGLGNIAGRTLSDILRPPSMEASAELLDADDGNSFADIVLDMTHEENAR